MTPVSRTASVGAGSCELSADGAGGLGGSAAVGGPADGRELIEPFDDLRTQTSTDNTDLLSKSRVDVHMSRHGSITVRAQQRELWPICGRCRQWLQSKGF